MFRVTSFDPADPPKDANGDIDHHSDFWEENSFNGFWTTGSRTVRHGAVQGLHLGPPSELKTQTHRDILLNFVIEPEVAFMELEGNMDLAEQLMRYVIEYVMAKAEEDLVF